MHFNFSFLKKNIRINVATVIIGAIFIYFLSRLLTSLKEEPITVYRVNESTISNNILLDGLAIRDEDIINSNTSGYVCYYVRDGEKVQKSSSLCSIDSSGQLYTSLSDNDSFNDLLKLEDYNEIRSTISLYKASYDNNAFYTSYNFENNINNKVLELTNEVLMQQNSNYSNGVSLSHTSSPSSGLVTYYIDGYEDFDFSNFDISDFDASTYTKQTLKTGDMVSAGSPILKLIPSEDWNVIAPLTNEQASTLQNKLDAQLNPEDKSVVPKLSFYLNNSYYSISMPCEIIEKEDGFYLNIILNKYLTNFLSERFLSVEIIMDDDIGLKVPVSSIVEKEVYKIPINYLSEGSNDFSANYFNVRLFNPETNEIELKQINSTIYKKDKDYCYVEMSDFSSEDVLYDYLTDETAAISLVSVEKIPGVYVVNLGYTEFCRVEIIKIIDEFALVQIGDSLTSFDTIVLDASLTSENQIIN